MWTTSIEETKIQRRLKNSLGFAVVCALFVSGCDRFLPSKESTQTSENTPTLQKMTPKPQEPRAAVLLPDFTQLVEEVGQAVVHIQATTTKVNNGIAGFPDAGTEELDPFFDFFRRIFPPEEHGNSNVNFGSGFIISNDGYVLTNAHVIRNSTSIKVSLIDKREFEAKLIGQDPASDTALLKIDAKDLPVVKIGRSSELKVGEWVAAIGAPFGFDNTVTSGIVSAKKRSLPGENYVPFIQTDVAINPGNSGGPLFNLKGEVVGVNSQIYSRSGGFMGISFAVPIDVTMTVAEQLKATGVVKRGQLGVIIQEVTYDLSKAFGLDRARGGLIVRVLPEGPAAAAKIKVGDVILAVNGELVESSSDLPVFIGYLPPQSKVRLTLWRQGKTEDIDVVLSELDQKGQTQKTPRRIAPNDQQSFTLPSLGVTLTPLSATMAQQHHINGGLQVIAVESRATPTELMRGDIIVSVGNQEVATEAALQEALKAYQDVAPVFVIRRGTPLFLSLKLMR